MKKQVIIGVSGLILICLFIVMSGCGGGSSTINPGPVPTIQVPTATPWPIGTLSIHTNMPGKWVVMQAFFQKGKVTSSDLIESDYNPNQEQILDESGNVIFNNVPLNSNVVIQVYNDSNKNTLLASTNTNFTGSGTVNLNQNEILPTPTGIIPIPTQAPTATPNPNQPTNTPPPTQTPGGPTATNTPASTNTPIAPTQTPGGPTATNTPASTNTPTPAPGATNTPTPSSSNPSITNVKKTSETGWDESMVETGTEVSIIGTNFGATQGTVTIGGYSATINSWTDTLIKVVVPAGALTGTGENKVVQITTAGSKTASWDELFVNSNLQTLLTKAYSSKEAVFNSDASILYDIAGKSVYGYNFPSMTPLSPASVLFSSEANFGCYCNENNRLYLSAADINSCNSTLGDKTMVTSIYSNSEGIRWNPVLKKLFLVIGETLYSFKTDGTSHQSHYTDPVALTGIDIDSDGYIYLTALNKVKTLKPDLTLESNQVEVGLGCYIYCKKINSSIKLLFVTAEEGGLSVIDVIKIKDNTTKTIIKKIKGFTAAQVLSGIHGHEGKVVVVDENMKKIHLMLF